MIPLCYIPDKKDGDKKLPEHEAWFFITLIYGYGLKQLMVCFNFVSKMIKSIPCLGST